MTATTYPEPYVVVQASLAAAAPDLTIRENLMVVALLRGVHRIPAGRLVDEILATTWLEGQASRLFATTEPEIRRRYEVALSALVGLADPALNEA